MISQDDKPSSMPEFSIKRRVRHRSDECLRGNCRYLGTQSALAAVPIRWDVVHSRAWLIIWIALIVVVGVPWGAFEAHPHWDRMAWIPFVSPPVDFGDV